MNIVSFEIPEETSVEEVQDWIVENPTATIHYITTIDRVIIIFYS